MKTFPVDPQDQPDFADFLTTLKQHNVRFVVVGAYAVIAHTGKIRTTKDLDVYVAADEPNLERCAQALGAFGAPGHLVDVAALRPGADEEFSGITFGFAPIRFDVLTKMKIAFDEVAEGRVEFDLAGTAIPVVSREHLLELKRVAVADDPKRKQDHRDIEALEDLDGRPLTTRKRKR